MSRSSGAGVATLYADTSALGRLLVQQPESAALETYLRSTPLRVASCELAITELLRMAARTGLDTQRVEELLARLDLLTLDAPLLRRAGYLPTASAFLRSMDAIHIAAAMELGAAAFLTYDRRQAEAARAAALTTVSPGGA